MDTSSKLSESMNEDANATAVDSAEVETKTSETTETVDSKEPVKQEEQPEVKTEETKDFNKEALLSDLHRERSTRKELQSKVEELTAQLEEKSTVSQELEEIKRRYDRLEQFILQAGSPISKALDSRTLTKELFETETEISDIVANWYKDNPTPTQNALGSKSVSTGSQPSMNDLLRAAIG